MFSEAMNFKVITKSRNKEGLLVFSSFTFLIHFLTGSNASFISQAPYTRSTEIIVEVNV